MKKIRFPRKSVVLGVLPTALFLVIAIVAFKELREKGCYCLGEDVPFAKPSVALASNELGFLVSADTGKPGEQQSAIAASMGRVCETRRCDFGILAGDNIYEDGVSSVNDPQFVEKYENAFGALGIRFFLVLGNHDVKDDTVAQVEYTRFSDSWTMPNTFYAFEHPLARFVGVNTNCDFLSFWLASDLFDGHDPEKWNVAFGHHSVYGLHSHGDGSPSFRWGWETWGRDRTDVYFSGHNHSLSHHRMEGEDVEYVVSGAGSKNTLGSSQTVESASETLFYDRRAGFVHVQFTRAEMVLTYFDEEGEIIYSYSRKHPRNV